MTGEVVPLKRRTLKSQLADRIADSERKEAIAPTFYDGNAWWQLSDAEVEVFEIEAHRWPRMMNTWHCFETFKGIADSAEYDPDLIAEARAEHPEWCKEGTQDDLLGDFIAFAKAMAGVTAREAYVTFRKQEMYNLREGLMDFKDGS